VKALSILQPWAWLIVRPDVTDAAQRARMYAAGTMKDVENRTWSTSYRGRLLIHAGKNYTKPKHAEYAAAIRELFAIELPRYDELARGAVIGEARLIGISRDGCSRWCAEGQYHWRLEDARPRPIVPWRGQLGLFDLPEQALEAGADLLYGARQ
jgi:hypothetical protein